MLAIANPVQLVCVASKTLVGIEVQDVHTKDTLKIVGIRPNPDGANISAFQIRQLIEEIAAQVTPEYTPVAPSKYKFSFITSEAVGFGDISIDAIDRDNNITEGYCCFQHRNSLPADCTETVVSSGKPIESIAAALEMRVSTKGARAERGGKPTKAQLIRENILRPGLAANKTPEEMIAEIVSKYDFKLSLARVYFKENIRKVM